AMTSYPILAAYCTARCPRPPRPEYGHAPAGRHARVTDRVKRRDPGAAHRRGLIQIKSVGNAGQRLDGNGDRFGPAAGVRDSRDLALGAMGDVASSAPRAVTAA